ncbi:hypothetical protein CA265_00895 [Sphingobacteriaceae bacterium GW460-11-11-14-LB5]|nr:hypothetical protein CA265_00895 [Sphingobacteriaceae bacterium GW460-11-11-14-LB5]
MKTNKKIYLGVFTAILLSISVISCKKQGIENNAETDVKKLDNMHEFNFGGNKILVKEDKGIYYLSDDVILTEQQFNLLKANNNAAMSSTARALIMNSLVKRWTNSIVYYSLSNLGADTASSLKAMQYIARVSPLTFVQRTSQTNYINFVKSTGNSSSVGMVGGAQNLNLYNYNTPGIIIHELFHALGVMHEQCRTDQSSNVIIHPENIPDDKEFNFNQVSATSYTNHGNFDFESIMMYEPYAFSSNGQPTITKLDGSTYQTSYPAANMSPTDIAGINQLYTGFTYVGLPANTSYEIASALDNTKLLNVPGSATADGTQVIIYTDGNSNNARWSVTKNADGYYRLSPLHAPTKALTVVGSATANGTKLEIRTHTGATSQQFNITPEASGYYIISPRNAPSKNVDVPGSATANGTLLNIWSYGGANNQKFKFNTF